MLKKRNFENDEVEETVYFTQNDSKFDSLRKERNWFWIVPISVIMLFILGFLFHEKFESQLAIQNEKIEGNFNAESERLTALLHRLESIENSLKETQDAYADRNRMIENRMEKLKEPTAVSTSSTSTTPLPLLSSSTQSSEASVSVMKNILRVGKIDPDPRHAMLRGVVGMPNETMYFLPRVKFEPLQDFQSESVIMVRLDGSLGRTFNKIKVVCKMCLMALRTNSFMYISPRDRMIVLDEVDTPMAEMIDMDKLIEGCPFWTGDSPPRHNQEEKMSLRTAYYSEWDNSFAESGFVRLATPIRTEVETWLQNKNFEKPLIGIHKRWLEGFCQSWVLQGKPAINPRICAIDYDFTIHMLKKFKLDPDGVNVFVAWDRQREEEYETFKKFGDRLVQIPPHWNILHETWLLVHSDYFFINSGSSIDQMVVEWRKAFNPSGTFVLEWISDDCEPSFDGKIRAKLKREQPSYYTCPDET